MKKQALSLLIILLILLFAGCTQRRTSDEESADPNRWADTAKMEAINYANYASSRMELSNKMLKEGLSPLYEYALENASVDWNQKALEMYEGATTSPAERKAQLEQEKFQPSEIEYALSNSTVNWNKQAQEEVWHVRLGLNSQYRTFSKKEVAQDLKEKGYSDENISYALSYKNRNWGTNAIAYLEDRAAEVKGSLGGDRIHTDYYALPPEERCRKWLSNKGFTQDEIDYAISNMPSRYQFTYKWDALQ